MMNSLLMLRDSSISSLQMLDEAGYTNIVGIKGGVNKYFRFVPNVARRRHLLPSSITAKEHA